MRSHFVNENLISSAVIKILQQSQTDMLLLCKNMPVSNTSFLYFCKDVNAAIASLKQTKSIHFVDWCPTGFKVNKV